MWLKIMEYEEFVQYPKKAFDKKFSKFRSSVILKFVSVFFQRNEVRVEGLVYTEKN